MQLNVDKKAAKEEKKKEKKVADVPKAEPKKEEA